jgi:death-on-curing family protein
MNSEYIISKDQIKWINKKYGGSLRSDAEIESALHLGKGKAVFRKIAYLCRAILVGHPFTDGNKRTALMTALTVLRACRIKTNKTVKENLVSEIKKIAEENITDVSRIGRLIRYAVTGD